MSHVVQFSEVSKGFKGEVQASKDLSFTIDRGEIFGLLGPNGAGKTTLLKELCGLITPDSGDIFVKGLNPIKQRKEVLKLIGYVTQHTALYDDLNAYDNMFYHANLYLENLKGIKVKIKEMLDFMQLSSVKNRPVKTFSGGMRRRLAIGQILLHEPELILLDEPTLGVDVQATHNIWDKIRDMACSGRTIIVTTNNMQEADYLSDRVMIIDQGEKVALDTPQNLKDMVDMDKIFVHFSEQINEGDIRKLDFNGANNRGSNYSYEIKGNQLIFSVERGEKALPEIAASLSSVGNITDIKMKKTSLDDVFLKLTGRELREM